MGSGTYAVPEAGAPISSSNMLRNERLGEGDRFRVCVLGS